MQILILNLTLHLVDDGFDAIDFVVLGTNGVMVEDQQLKWTKCSGQ